ncbi:WD40-repeat-containing domain protein [Mycena floridula]|nr:WD40-repeat-containing domain protein [Mycena floridula]
MSGDIEAPPRKRLRQETKRKREPRLFVPFRALGLITNHVPFVLQTRSFKGATEGPRIHIVTCLGRAWAMWEGGKMTLLFVSPDASEPISCLAMDGDAVWASSGSSAIKYHRGKEVLRVTNPLGSFISFITLFGSQIIALTEDGELESMVQFDSGFTATSILHPATYINKVLVSSVEGTMQLWNIRSGQVTCIHKFSFTNLSNGVPSAITASTQSPAIDVVGLGFASGEISIYDIRADERMLRMFMDGGAIKALGFRSDGEAILASASSNGHIALWDLNDGGRLLHVIRGAHDGGISSIEWVPGQPLLISSGEDNSVKQWLFDSPTAIPRLLKFRSGHHAPPHLIRYYGEDGKQILTASRDRSLRCLSVVRDSRSFELSQGSLAKKATSLSIPLTSLNDETLARTWTMQNKKLGKHSLSFAKDAKVKQRGLGSVKAVCVTACGNFGLASSSNGDVTMWNMQSGIKRKTYDIGPCTPEVAERFRNNNKKNSTDRCITGLATDPLNKTVIASTLDGTVNFFDFHTTKLEHTIILPSAAVSMHLHPNSLLLAVMKRIVREFGGFRGRILDITFSSDSRWLIATSLDCIIRTFDIPSARLIDAFRTPSVATTVSFSPASDFLATAHVDSVGVYLWVNRAQYGNATLQAVTEDDIDDILLPSTAGTLESLSPLQVEAAPLHIYSTPPQLDGELVTLTLLPRSRWQTLINLDVIQQRNKPKEAPKAPEKAPFFLPTLPGVEPRFAPPSADAASNAESVFLQKLLAESMKTFGCFLQRFLVAMRQRLLSHRDFDAVQALQKVFFAINGEMLIANSELKEDMRKLLAVQETETDRILTLVSASIGTLSFIRDL